MKVLLGTRIKEIAKEKRIPLYILEEKAGIARGSLSKWNENEPGIHKVQKIAECLGVSIEEMIKQNNNSENIIE